MDSEKIQSIAEQLGHYYKVLEIKYPKFHKMDVLCKAGIIGAALVLKDTPADRLQDLSILFSNSVSSTASDLRHLDNFTGAGPASPAVFVYTLPNIVIGEICIKHQIHGENVFLLSREPDWKWMEDYTSSFYENKKSGEVLIGWLDVADDQLNLFMALCGVVENETVNLSTQLIKRYSEWKR